MILQQIFKLALIFCQSFWGSIKVDPYHRRTGRCGVLAIATWAAWFRAAQGQLLTKKKEERKGRKGKKERKKEKEKKRKKREEKKGKKTWDRYGPVIPCLDFVRHCIQGP